MNCPYQRYPNRISATVEFFSLSRKDSKCYGVIKTKKVKKMLYFLLKFTVLTIIYERGL